MSSTGATTDIIISPKIAIMATPANVSIQIACAAVMAQVFHHTVTTFLRIIITIRARPTQYRLTALAIIKFMSLDPSTPGPRALRVTRTDLCITMPIIRLHHTLKCHTQLHQAGTPISKGPSQQLLSKMVPLLSSVPASNRPRPFRAQHQCSCRVH